MAQWATPPPPILYRGSSAVGSCPVVVCMHASGGSPTSMQATSRLQAAADSGGFAVVFPSAQTLNSSGSAAWQGSSREVTNLAYLKANIASWVTTVGGDATKVYLTGFSSGAFMSLYAAWEGSMTIRGIAPISGWVDISPTNWNPYSRVSALSMLYIMGTNDFAPVLGNVNYQGQRVSALAVATGNGHGGSATTVATVSPVTTETWTDTNVLTKVIAGGTHQYPGAPQATGVDTQVDATAIIAAWMLADAAGGGPPPPPPPITSLVKDLKTGGQTNNTSSTTITTTLNASAAAPNTVVVIVGNNSSQSVNKVADSLGNTYVRATSDSYVGVTPQEGVSIWVTNQDVAPCVSGTVVTATLDGTNARKIMFVQEHRGQLSVGVATSNSSTGSATLNSGTTAFDGVTGGVVIAAFMIGTLQASWTHDANYQVAPANLLGLTDRTLLTEYQDLTGSGTQSAGGTIPTSTTYAGCIVTLHPPVLPIGSALPPRIAESAGSVTNVNSVASFVTSLGAVANGDIINFTGNVDGAAATTTISRVAAAGAPVTITANAGVLLTNWSWKMTGAYLRWLTGDLAGGPTDGLKITDAAHDIEVAAGVHLHGHAGHGLSVVTGTGGPPSNIQLYGPELNNNTQRGLNYAVNRGNGVVTNVLSHDNAQEDILCYPDVPGLIVSAVIADGPGGVKFGSATGLSDNMVVVGVIATNSSGYGIAAVDTVAGDIGDVAYDCIGFGNATGDFQPGGGFTYDHCSHLDPMYVNRAGHDYHLKAGSPAQAYVTLDQQKYLPVLDRDGNLRVTPDAGCYIADVTTPPQPGNIALPVVSGAVIVGEVLTTTDGSWSPTPTFIQYAWKLETGVATGVYSYINGAVTNTYVVKAGDTGRRIISEVTAGISLVTNPSFDGSFETGDYHPWQIPQASNYGYVDTTTSHFGPWNIETTIVGQGNYSGKFSLPASPTVKQRSQVIQPRNVDLGTDDYYSFMVWVPLDWTGPGVIDTDFFIISELNFQQIPPPLQNNISLSLRADHLTLVMQTGQLNASAPYFPWNSNADASPNQSGVNLYAIPPGSLTLGVWHELAMHFFWATDSTGVAEIWHREKGPNAWVQTVNLTGHPTLQRANDGTLPTSTTDMIGAYRAPCATPLDIELDGFARHPSLASAQSFLPPSSQSALSNAVGPVPGPVVIPPPTTSPPSPQFGSRSLSYVNRKHRRRWPPT